MNYSRAPETVPLVQLEHGVHGHGVHCARMTQAEPTSPADVKLAKNCGISEAILQYPANLCEKL